jgi:ABC-type nitrate/sulfonate/bicarbonate transport system ATPase subunit
MAIFEFDRVSLSYSLRVGKREVLQDITFAVGEGEILTICGASGTGKTSLLRILAGLTRQTNGAARFRGQNITGPAGGIALVFQDYSNALLQWRTVARNVALGIERRAKGDEIRKMVAEALQLVGLQKNADDYPWQLSGGMQQRVQIARALALKPSVLLMDEPFAALDAMTKASLQDELLRVRQQTGASIVFITHDIEEAVYLGDRVAVLRGTPGKLAAVFDVNLPQPREQVATRELPGFLALRHEVHDAIGGHP